jgi:hypothetical protein
MCANENFRNKVAELANKLNASVANKSDIIVSFDAALLQTQKTIKINPVSSEVIGANGEIYLQRQDVFLAEKVAYYYSRKSYASGSTNSQDEIFECSDAARDNAGVMGFNVLYKGVLTFTQRKTVVASNYSLINFLDRSASIAVFSSAQDGRDVVELTGFKIPFKELVPYWLLSGSRDNEFLLEYSQTTPVLQQIKRVYIHLQGVIFPNAAERLERMS